MHVKHQPAPALLNKDGGGKPLPTPAFQEGLHGLSHTRRMPHVPLELPLARK
jgi:hypothetical protein